MGVAMMDTKSLVVKVLTGALAGSLLACATDGRGRVSPGVVEKVGRVEVVQDAPIAVDLGLGQDEAVDGENFVLSARFVNVTDEPVVLRAFAVENALTYMWLSVDGDPFMRVTRIHPGDVCVPPEGQWTTVFEPHESVEYRVFLSRIWGPDDEMLGISRLSIVVCPVLVVVQGDEETWMGVESNILEVKLRRPTGRERQGIRYLTDLGRGRGKQSIPYKEQYRLFLRRYPEVPYAAGVRYNLVRGMNLHEYKKGASEIDEMSLESIRFCLANGSPFADAVLQWDHIEFFAMTEKWDLLERAAKALAEAPRHDRRYHELQSRVGAFGVEVATGESECKEPTWRAKLEPVLLKCLELSLTRGDEHAKRIAPRVLAGLEKLKQWALLERAASLILENNPDDEKATQALTRAEANRKQD